MKEWGINRLTDFIHESCSIRSGGEIQKLVYFNFMDNHKKPPIHVSFIIPCLNEELSLSTVIQEIHNSYSEENFTYQIVVADNGSVDKSREIALSMGAKVVQVPQKGYGAALIAGINSAEGKFGVMGDADGSYTFGDARPMIKMLENGQDLVIGNRFEGGIAPGAMPSLHKYLGNPVLSFLGKLFYRIPVNDFHCGLRAFNCEKIKGLNLQSPGMEFASEMIVSASHSKLRIAEVPVTLKKDLRDRPPHLNTWRDGWRHLKYLFSRTPGWTFIAPACMLSILALALVLVSTEGPIQRNGIGFSYRTSITVGSLAGLITASAWAFAIGKEIMGNGFKYPRFFLELSITVSIIFILSGGVVILNLDTIKENGGSIVMTA